MDEGEYRFNTSDFYDEVAAKEKEEFKSYCKSVCWKRDCKYIRYMDLGFTRDHVDNRLLLDVEEFKIDVIGQPRLSTFQYWLQVGGLISSLVGISVFSMVENIIRRASRSLATGSRALRLINASKNMLCLALVLLVVANFGSISDMYEPVIENIELDRNYSYPHYKVYFCFFATKMYKDSPYIGGINYTIDEKEYGRSIFEEHTANHLFERMKGFDEVFMSVQSSANETSNSTENDIFQMNPEHTLFHRTSLCFELLLNITNRKHFIFTFNTSSNKVYVMKDKMLLTLRTRRYFDDQRKELEVIARSGSQAKCKDYKNQSSSEEDEDLPFKCGSKQNCIDWCLVNEYVRFQSKLPETLLFKKDLPQYGNYSFSQHRNKTANIACRKRYAANDCNHTIIIRHGMQVPLARPNQNRWNISLFDREKDSYEITEIETEKLLLDIFTIYTILLGINVPSLVFLVARVLKFEANRKFRYFKVASFFVFTFCFIGYSIWVSNEVFYKFHQFIYYYDSFRKDEQMNINICVEHGLDTRVIRTGAELDQLTKNISLETMIDYVGYMDPGLGGGVKTLKPGEDLKNHSELIGFKEPVFYRKKEKELKCVSVLFKIQTSDLSMLFVEMYLGIKVKVGY